MTRNGVHTTADGIDLHHTRYGSGRRLVFVSSVLLPRVGWERFVRDLASSYEVTTYDLRNQGDSSAGDPSLASHVGDLDSLLAAGGGDKPYVLAHSSGTQIATEFAARHPGRLGGLVLLGPLVNPTGAARRKLIFRTWLHALDEGGTEGMFDLIWPHLHSDSTVKFAGRALAWGTRQRFVQGNPSVESIRRTLIAMSETDHVFDLAAIDCPTLLLTGEDDFLSTASALREIDAAMSDARVQTLPEAGHIAYFEAPRPFQAAVRSFLDEIEGR